ncbi:MAG: hypothetical protein U9Q67_04440, partial [Patescibacteria group bacterium]|nr:hypothetical protein [Patescibacteria group bacterium]
AQNPNRQAKSNKLVPVLLFVVVVLLAALVGLGYLYLEQKEKVADPTIIATEEMALVKEKVGKHFQLPDEEPTLATVMDAEALRDENPEFYRNATNGDKLLIYTTMAILYNPTDDIIVNVAPVIREPAMDTSGTKMNVELRNGTADEVNWSDYETSIAQVMGDNYEIAATDSASADDYLGTVIYDLSGTKATEVAQLAEVLSGSVGEALPEGESASDADVVIIIGR